MIGEILAENTRAGQQALRGVKHSNQQPDSSDQKKMDQETDGRWRTSDDGETISKTKSFSPQRYHREKQTRISV
ncbi:MAG: hypothetical protein U9R40_04975 [Synergistota bacterium]|nr:hypothetical protein [Synergistota bacterium]